MIDSRQRRRSRALALGWPPHGGGLVVLLVATSLHRRSVALPVWVAVFAALIDLMLITKPNAGVPAPDLSGPGRAGLVLGLSVIVVAVGHAMHAAIGRRRGDL